ncbi:MAG: cysteine hydrolase [Acidimicrobiia bacterium]
MALNPSLVDPARTAIVINEFQGGVVGAASPMKHIADSARPAIEALVRLLAVARPAGVNVVQCVIANRSDGRGGNVNTAFGAMARKRREAGEVSTVDPVAHAAVIPELGPKPSDFVMTRLHGMSPMSDTGLDPLLRNLGVTTVVCAGASLNVGIIALANDAMNRGYNVIVVGDACSSIPPEYGADMLRYSFPIISRVTTTDELIEIWKQ